MYGTFVANEEEARKFWREVSRGGVEFEENHPTTVLDAFLKSIIEDKRKLDLKPANLYQASIYAWNAFREGKTISPFARPGATSRLEFRTRSEQMDKLKEAHELLQRLRDQHPNDTEEELSRRFAAAVRGDSMMFRAIVKDPLGDLLREPQRKRKDNRA